MAGAEASSAVDNDEAASASAETAGAGPFRFVTGNYRPEDRSHVMRESWRQRKGQTSSKACPGSRKQKLAKKPLPGESTSDEAVYKPAAKRLRVEDTESRKSQSCLKSFTNEDSHSQLINSPARVMSPRDYDGYDLSYSQNATDDWSNRQLIKSVSAQATAASLGYALAAGKTDPFDTCPVSMSAEDQGLLHHWLSTYATMMFIHPTESTFNPMRDVWIPMDFSNSASFHGMLAHSASHLAYLRGENFSIQAIIHKLEATRLVNLWLSDPEKATSDDVMSATLRLLTYERYWGAEDIWRIHRNGIAELLKARGGFEHFGDNWRLELVVKLVSLMSKPSWFYAANQVSAISHEPPHTSPLLTTAVTLDHQKLQGLWFLSFVEDIRTLTIALARTPAENEPSYPAIAEATHLLYSLWSTKTTSETSLRPDPGETSRLTCLLYLLNILKESRSSPSPTDSRQELAELDRNLQETESFWACSAENLQITLLEGTSQELVSSEKLQYIKSLIEAIRLLSPMTRGRVEQCLLQILGGDMIEHHHKETSWTVDSLLMEIRGQIWGNWF